MSLLSNTAMYAVANLLQRGMMLILLPLYARYFSKAEFGAMDLIYQSILVIIIVSSLGMPQGLPRGMSQRAATDHDIRRMIGVLTLFVLPSILMISALLLVFSGELAAALFNSTGETEWVRLGVAFMLCMVLQQYPLQILKARQCALEYSLWSIATFLIVTAGNIYFVVSAGMGLSGMLWANVVGFGLIGALLFFRCLGEMQLNLEFWRLRPLLEFGLPMMPALLGRKVLEASDRYMIPQYHSLDTLGDYVMGVKVANIVEVIILVPFLFAWQPFFYAVSGRQDAKRIFARVTFYFIAVAIVVFMGMLILHRDVLQFIGNGAYGASSAVVLLLVMSALVNGVQYTISPGIHLGSKLAQEAALMLLAAVLNIGLNLLLIPPYGADGAALATLIAYLAYLVSTFWLAQRHYPIDYPWVRISRVLLIGGVFLVLIFLANGLLLQSVFLLAFVAVGLVPDIRRNDPEIWQVLQRKLRIQVERRK